ncbi:MAG: glycoside hydrolase family 57 protein [Calditrichia bacterium]
MSQNKLSVAILWHQHQPFYKSSQGIYQMPWVRFHGTKDYLDMLLVLEEFPEVKQTVNLVPSLIYQLNDYVEHDAKDLIWLLTEKNAEDLTVEDKKQILEGFFLANTERMIKPYERFYELYLKYRQLHKLDAAESRAQAFSVQEMRDLQVWYNLTWIGMESRKRPEFAALFAKGRNFTEEDKTVLLRATRELLADVIPQHRKMWESGQLELTTTPFYHPILPLLCDTNIAQESSPGITLPKIRFSHPEDADEQIKRGVKYFEKMLGKKPRGMWPSEGSVSNQALELIARHGVEWVATDEGILANTLGRDFSHTRIYQPYLLHTGKNQINMFFRDHYLSDAIGFVYSNWSEDRAVEDFMNRIRAIRQILVDRYGEDSLSNFVLPIILDGENCWEYYREDGKPFLRALYKAFSEDPLINTATFSEILDRQTEKKTLNSIHPGSWIQSNFNIWIGAQEDNLSWEALAETRKFLVEQQKTGMYSEEVLQQAWEKIYIAEGSDWNWWYGDDHSSANDLEFDQLYREHLMDVYRLLGQEVPTRLYQTIKKIHFDRFVVTRPKNFVDPVLDGKSSNFYEWVGAALYDLSKTEQGSMHQVARHLKQLWVGFNKDNLFVRMDFDTPPPPLSEYVISVKRPIISTIVVSPLRGMMELFRLEGETKVRKVLEPTFGLDKILEIAIPFAELGVSAGETIGFQVAIKLNNQPIDEYPRINLIEIEVPSEYFELVEWSV